MKRIIGACLFVMLFAANFAMAGVVVIVNAKSPVKSLSKEQITDIFMMKVSTFPDGSMVVPIEQVEGSAQRQEFNESVEGKSAPQLKAYWSKQIFSGKGSPPREVPTNAEVMKLISTNQNMIGYVDKSAVDSSVKVIFSP